MEFGRWEFGGYRMEDGIDNNSFRKRFNFIIETK